MSSNNNGNLFGARDDFEELLTIKVLILGAIMLGPALLLALGKSAREKALQYHLVVPERDALVSIPTSGVGFDLSRLAAVLFLLVALIFLAVHADRKRRRRKALAEALARGLS